VLTAVVAGVAAEEAVALIRAGRDPGHLHHIVEIQDLLRDDEETPRLETLRHAVEILTSRVVEVEEKGEVVGGRAMVARGHTRGPHRAEAIVDMDEEPEQAEVDQDEGVRRRDQLPVQSLDQGVDLNQDPHRHDGAGRLADFQDLPQPTEAGRLRLDENAGDPRQGPGRQALPAEVPIEAGAEMGIATEIEGDVDLFPVICRLLGDRGTHPRAHRDQAVTRTSVHHEGCRRPPEE
jgi:hypothetical protein